jgi:hypothetical protein
MEPLRKYNAEHQDENCETTKGFHENELFWNCTFKELNGLTLKDCVLRNSRFFTEKLEDALGFTFTVGDCHTFEDVEYSEFLFDLFLVMLLKTKGNTEKRRKILDMVGHDRVRDLLQQFKTLEAAGCTQ